MKIRTFKLPSEWVSFHWHHVTGQIMQKPIDGCNIFDQEEVDPEDIVIRGLPMVIVKGINPEIITRFIQETIFGNGGARWSYIVCKQQNQNDKAQLDIFAKYQVVSSDL